MKVLIAGESWTIHSIHQKGFDSFTTTDYAEGVAWLRNALEANGHKVTFQPAHIASREFPSTLASLREYDCVVLSDIGANTLLLHPDTFSRSKVMPNRLEILKQYVLQGGGLVMIGGYMTFQGIDGKARYQGSPVEDVLPVRMMVSDDRVEMPEGVTPTVNMPMHEIVSGIDGAWPQLLGLNAVTPSPAAETIASAGFHPLLLSGEFGKGRSVAFTSDCAPHWAPPEFVEWRHYERLWNQIVLWASASGNMPKDGEQQAPSLLCASSPA